MTKTKINKRASSRDLDGQYFLKLVVLLIVGTFWIRISDGSSWQIPLPLGLIPGIVLVRRERLQNDRKIMYSLLLLSMMIGFWALKGVIVII